MFDGIEIEKRKFHYYNNAIMIDDVDIDKMISNKVSCRKGCKHFIGYKDSLKVKPLCIMLPKTSGCTKSVYKTKCISLLIKDDELLKK